VVVGARILRHEGALFHVCEEFWPLENCYSAAISFSAQSQSSQW